MNEEYQKSIEEEITLIKRENLKLKNDMEEMIITNERKIDDKRVHKGNRFLR